MAFAITVLFVTSILHAAMGQADIQRLGNFPEPCETGIPYANTTILFESAVRSDGILFGLSAYFVHRKSVVMQLWRPSNILQREFMLIHEIRFTPLTTLTKEDIYIKDLPEQSCVTVRSGDRIGIFTENSPSAVCYSFDSFHPQTLTYLNIGQGESLARIGSTKEFEYLQFPFTFSVEAYIHTDLNPYLGQETPTCPESINIPQNVPEPEAEAGPRGHTGSTGATGRAGRPGLNGATGVRGAIGLTGNIGPKGATGAQGQMGPTGQQGPPGASYMEAVADGQAVCGCKKDGMLQGEQVMLGFLLWLTAITTIVLSHLAFSCRKNFPKMRKYHYQNEANKWTENIRETTREYKTEGGLNSGYEASNRF